MRCFFSKWHFLCWGCVDQQQNVADWVPKDQCINLTNSGNLDPDRFPKISNPYTKQKMCVYDSYCHSQKERTKYVRSINSLYWVFVNPFCWGLMSLSPIIWEMRGNLDPAAPILHTSESWPRTWWNQWSFFQKNCLSQWRRNLRSVQVSYEKIHPRKLTCPLEKDYFSRENIFQPLIFRGHVSFQGSSRNPICMKPFLIGFSIV